MNCPECGAKSAIVEVRTTSYGRRRRHRCKSCKYQFTTVEILMTNYKKLLSMVSARREIFAAVARLKKVLESYQKQPVDTEVRKNDLL